MLVESRFLWRKIFLQRKCFEFLWIPREVIYIRAFLPIIFLSSSLFLAFEREISFCCVPMHIEFRIIPTILILILSNSFRYGKRKYTRNISISIFLIIIYFPFIFRNRKSRTSSIEMSTKYVKIPCCKRKQKKFPWKGIILTEDNGLCNFYSLKIYSF